MPAADDAFVPLGTWLAREGSSPPPSQPQAVAATAASEPSQLDALARELRLVRARLADFEDALADRT